MDIRRPVFADTDSSKAVLPSVAFISLNILDACLTWVALELGGYELNPLLGPALGSNALFKWLISSVVVLALALLNRPGLLKPLNLAMLLICAWNLLAIWSWS
jgi:hypothetical protein